MSCLPREGIQEAVQDNMYEEWGIVRDRRGRAKK